MMLGLNFALWEQPWSWREVDRLGICLEVALTTLYLCTECVGAKEGAESRNSSIWV